MSIYEQFIPGQWIDTIDVNDFVNLNKKPFFEKPDFLKDSSDKTKKLAQKITSFLQSNSTYFSIPYIDKQAEVFPGIPMLQTNLIHAEHSLFSTYFEQVVTTEMKKALKMNLFSFSSSTVISPSIHPDVRKVALYGTKALIRDKKMYLKTLEKHLQTYEWMERRMMLHVEIESLKDFEKFAKRYKVNVSEPAKNAKEAISFTYLTILFSANENPSISFSLTQIIPFLDIYIEHDLAKKIITEEEAQELIEQFVLKLWLVKHQFLSKEKATHCVFGETIACRFITKTTYRFLHALEKYHFLPFSLRIIWEDIVPEPFKPYIDGLIHRGFSIHCISEKSVVEKHQVFLTEHGMNGIIGEDILVDGGYLDLEKVFYLALNAGKDIETNFTLQSVTQPTRSDTVEYEEIFSKLKDFLAYILTLYAELMNLSIYLNEKENNYPFRFSLMNNLYFYKIQFGFSNMEKVLHILSAIHGGNYTVKREQTWIKEIIPNETDYVYNEAILAHFVSFIEKELHKIPLYKSGKAAIRIYQTNDPYVNKSIQELNTYFTLVPEYTNATFSHRFKVSYEEGVSSFIDQWFRHDFSEIYLTSEADDKSDE